MLNQDFKNGQKVDLHSAFALFVIMMGFLFYLDAAPGTHAIVALMMILFGFAWHYGHHAYQWWKLSHSHR